MLTIREILAQARGKEASDVHLAAGVEPVYRIHGELVKTGNTPLSTGDMAKLFEEIAADKEAEREYFARNGDVDFCFADEAGRYRVNAFRQKGTTAMAVRVIRNELPSLQELGIPEVVKTFALKKSGLVLAAGSAGSGKSTTLAAMVDFINTERAAHIITLEDPIEYWHHSKKSVINQREIKKDTRTFHHALRAALRQDPDVILIGEMRDAETMEVAITAAETGHLVLATLHTKSAAAAVARMIDAFPPHQRPQVQSQVAYVLEGVIAQQLVAVQAGDKRVAAVEILVATSAVRNLIREGKFNQIDSVIQTGAQFGMQTMAAAVRGIG